MWKLRRLKKVINEEHNAGNSEARDDALNEFVDTVNDTALDLNLETAKSRNSVMKVLEITIVVIDDVRRLGEGNLYSFLYFDTFRSLARVANVAGDIG